MVNKAIIDRLTILVGSGLMVAGVARLSVSAALILSGALLLVGVFLRRPTL